MKIRVDDIKDKIKPLFFEEPAESFPSLATLRESGECDFLTPLTIELSVAREFDHIRVKGNVFVAVRLGCSRCLAGFDAELRSVFTMIYTKESGIPQDAEEVELGEEELISVTYAGDEIDFTPEIAEQVIMELPYKPLCREECLGLCPVCGADLNSGDCGCERGSSNLKFSALKNFKVEK